MHKTSATGSVPGNLLSVMSVFFLATCLLFCNAPVHAQDTFPRIDPSALTKSLALDSQDSATASEQPSGSLIPALYKPDYLEDLNIYYYNGWESNYYFEGRDYLDGDGLIVYDLDATWKYLEADVWYVHSPDQSYDEINYMIRFNYDIKNFHFNASYTYLDFLSDGGDDQELAAGVVIDQLPADLAVSFLAYHSVEAHGFFARALIYREFPITDSLTFTPVGFFGSNQNYIPDGHDGPNNAGIRFKFNYILSENLTLVVRMAQNWAINRDRDLPGDQQLKTFFNGGVGLLFSY